MHERDKITSAPTVESKTTDLSASSPRSAKSSEFDERAASQDSTPKTKPPAIPDYQLVRRIGGGSYGDVWLARSATGVLRALKIVWRHTFEDDRPFQREFEGIQHFERLSREHPSQLALFHVGRGEGYFYYVMELADDLTVGRDVPIAPRRAEDSPPYQPHTLRADLEHGRLPAARVLEIGLALTEALSHLHTNGLVHRDVKPSNVILVNGRPKLADIGLVTDAGDTRSIVGTEGYLAPEGPGTPQADLFALGKVLYEAVTGLDRRQLPQLPPDLRSWPDAKRVFELNEIFLKACATDAGQRYQSAEEMRGEMVLLQQGQSVRGRRVWQHRIRAVRRIGFTATAMILVAVGAAALWQKMGRPRAPVVPPVNEDGATGTLNPSAAESYRLGLPGLHRGTSEGFRQAWENFSAATEADPQFAAAYARLFEIYLMSEDHSVAIIDGKTEKLNELSTKLLKLAPTNAETHAAQAIVKFLNEGKWAEAEKGFEQALALDPNCRMALTYYGYLLTRQRRVSEARPVLEQARKLDPVSPLITKFLGHCEYVQRHFEKALLFYQRASEQEPSYPSGHYWAGRAYLATTNYAQALDEFERYEVKQGLNRSGIDWRYKDYRKALDDGGPVGVWKKRIEMTDEEDPYLRTPYKQAERFARLNDKEQALFWLGQALLKRDSMEHLLVDEFWDGFRQDEKFKAIVRQVGLNPWER